MEKADPQIGCLVLTSRLQQGRTVVKRRQRSAVVKGNTPRRTSDEIRSVIPRVKEKGTRREGDREVKG